jgi:phage major head subunit gpT-like protein
MVENQWKGSADLVVIDELEAAATTWYLFDTSKGIKPLLFQLRQAPEFTYLTSPTDQNVFWHKQFVMGVEARGAADVTLPFLAYKGVG